MAGRCGNRVTGVVDGARRDSVASHERPPYRRSGVDTARNKNPTVLGAATAAERYGGEKSERRVQGVVGFQAKWAASDWTVSGVCTGGRSAAWRNVPWQSNGGAKQTSGRGDVDGIPTGGERRMRNIGEITGISLDD